MYYNDYDRSWGRALKKTLYIDNVWTLGKHASWLLAFFCGFMLLSVEKAFAQATVGSTTSSTIAGSATLTFSHTPGAGANKLLLVAVGTGSTDSNSGGDSPTVNSVTYNGVPMTLVIASQGDETRSVLYSLLNPSDGPANVVVTTSGSTVAGGDDARINASATTFINVDQITPLGTPIKVEQSGTGVGTLNLIIPSTTANDKVYSAMTLDEGGSLPTITTATANGQTELSNQSGSSTYTATHSASSYKPGTGSSVTSTYTFTAQDHSGVAVLVKGIVCTLPNCGTVTLVKNP
jgi:hypothetical protein